MKLYGNPKCVECKWPASAHVTQGKFAGITLRHYDTDKPVRPHGFQMGEK